MIRQLKFMMESRDGSLHNALSDVEAIVSILCRQGKAVDTAHMISMVLNAFSQKVQEEVAKKEFDSDKNWSMEDILNQLLLVVKRRNI